MGDIFGISSGIKGAARIYLHTARRSGRTTAMLNTLKDGDRIVFVSQKEARRFERLCSEKKLKVQCVCVDPREPLRIFDYNPAKGRTIFDHSWVEKFYMDALDDTEKRIRVWQDRLSHPDEEPVVTNMMEKELSRFRNWM